MRTLWRHLGRTAGALAAIALVVSAVPAHASASMPNGGGGSSAFCTPARELKALYDAEAGIDMKDPHSVRKVQRIVVDLRAASPGSLRPAFRPLLHFYDLVVGGDINLLAPDTDRYFAASEPAARGAYRIAQALHRRCGVAFRG